MTGISWHAPPSPSPLQLGGGGVKNLRNVFAMGGGRGQKIFFGGGGGGGGEGSRNFEVKTKIT